MNCFEADTAQPYNYCVIRGVKLIFFFTEVSVVMQYVKVLMNDLDFTALFSSISVISRRWAVIIKGCVQGTPVYGREDSASSGTRTRDR